MKKLALAAALISVSGASAAAQSVDEMSQLTIIPNHNATLIRNFNPYLPGRLHTARDFIYEQLVIFNELKANRPEFRLATDYYFSDGARSNVGDLLRVCRHAVGGRCNIYHYFYGIPQHSTPSARTKTDTKRPI